MAGRTIDKAHAAAKDVQAEFLQTTSVLSTLQLDLEDDTSISRAFDHISNKYGRLDILINNAGESSRFYLST